MNETRLDDQRAVCACGSGLTADRCCALDWNASWPQPASAPEAGRARAELAAGNAAVAEPLIVDFLQRAPTHVGGYYR